MDQLVTLLDEHGYELVLRKLAKLLNEEADALKTKGHPDLVVSCVSDAAEHCSEAAMSYYCSTK
jgi:hypothetical protein